MQITKENILKAMKQCKYSYSTSRFRELKDLKEKQIANALKHICPGSNRSDIIGMLDETFTGNGKSGFVLTTDKLYFSNKYYVVENKSKQFISLADATSVMKKVNRKEVGIVYSNEQTEWFYCGIYQEDIFDFLRLLIQYTKESSTETPKESDSAKQTKSTTSQTTSYEAQMAEISSLIEQFIQQTGVQEESKDEQAVESLDSLFDELNSPDEDFFSEKELLADAQRAFEKAMILWMRGGGLYEERNIRSWAEEALKHGHPRAQSLLWLMDGKHWWHIYESSYLFSALCFRKEGNPEQAEVFFTRAEYALDIDGMLCYAWYLYTDKGDIKDIIKAEKILSKTSDKCKNNLLWKEVNNLCHKYPEQYLEAKNKLIEIRQSITEARAAADNKQIDLAHEKYAFAYEWDPSPEIAYEYAFVAQYRDTIAPTYLLEKAVKAGYAPAAKTLLDFYGPDKKNYRSDYWKWLGALRRLDREAALPHLYTWKCPDHMRPNFYNQAPRYHTAHSPYNLIDRICTPTTRDTILAGDMYHFGTKNWLVIERQENKLLLLATEVIDLHAFHKKQKMLHGQKVICANGSIQSSSNKYLTKKNRH